jgi:hypothetical protein
MSSDAIFRQETIWIITLGVLKHFWVAMKHVSHNHRCGASRNEIIVWKHDLIMKKPMGSVGDYVVTDFDVFFEMSRYQWNTWVKPQCLFDAAFCDLMEIFH